MFLNESKGRLKKLLATRLKADIRFYEKMLKTKQKDINALCKDEETMVLCNKIKNELDSYSRRIAFSKYALEKMTKKKEE